MKKILIAFIFLLTFNAAFSQSENSSYSQVAARFEKYYNAGQPDSVFNMFNADFSKYLSLINTKSFLANTRTHYGTIIKREFISYESSFAVYKTTCEKTICTLKISVDVNMKINGLSFLPVDTLPKPERNKTILKLPFSGEWTVLWGGDTEELNYHVISKAQKNAFDILIRDKDGNTHRGTGSKNEDYYAFGQPIITPCDGEVVLVINGVKENSPGEMNGFNAGGNMVVLKTINKEYLVFCHLKHQSIKVTEGQKVQQGELLGQCGNTGNSSEAHLHFHIQNVEDINKATGIKCYFGKLSVNGNTKTDYSPIKGDKIKNE